MKLFFVSHISQTSIDIVADDNVIWDLFTVFNPEIDVEKGELKLNTTVQNTTKIRENMSVFVETYKHIYPIFNQFNEYLKKLEDNVCYSQEF